jgi:hypothetical protein
MTSAPTPCCQVSPAARSGMHGQRPFASRMQEALSSSTYGARVSMVLLNFIDNRYEPIPFVDGLVAHAESRRGGDSGGATKVRTIRAITDIK